MLSFFKSGFEKIKRALKTTNSLLSDKIRAIFSTKIDAETTEKLEQILYEANLGSKCTHEMTKLVASLLKKHQDLSGELVLHHLRKISLDMLKEPPRALKKEHQEGEPLAILIVGVNGSGKTTSIAKLGKYFIKMGKTVLLSASDTFRAAAVEQLSFWAHKIGASIVKGTLGGDPASVVFDAMQAFSSRKYDLLLIDTAGRLENKTQLMEELGKIRKVCHKIDKTAPHETWLVIDATTGQNAIDQALAFDSVTPLTGLIVTKLDGSAKGGILLRMYQELKIPILFVGLGEGENDLAPFQEEDYVNALFDAPQR